MIHVVCVMCGMQSMLCTVFSQSYVQDLVCVMSGIYVYIYMYICVYIAVSILS